MRRGDVPLRETTVRGLRCTDVRGTPAEQGGEMKAGRWAAPHRWTGVEGREVVENSA